MDEQRAEFEAWAKSKGAPKDGWWIRQIDDGGYSCHAVDMAWDAWQAAPQRQQERVADLEAQVQALSLDAGRLRTSQSRTGFMCLTDFQHELGEASGGISVYADEDDLKKHRNCWKGCGILKVEVVAAIAAGKGEG